VHGFGDHRFHGNQFRLPIDIFARNRFLGSWCHFWLYLLSCSAAAAAAAVVTAVFQSILLAVSSRVPFLCSALMGVFKTCFAICCVLLAIGVAFCIAYQ